MRLFSLGFRVLVALSTISLAACGNNVRPGRAASELPLVPTSLTGGEDTEGRPYTNFDGEEPAEPNPDQPASPNPNEERGSGQPQLDLLSMSVHYSQVANADPLNQKIQVDIDLGLATEPLKVTGIIELNKIGQDQTLLVENAPVSISVSYSIRCLNADCRNFELQAKASDARVLHARYIEEQRLVKLSTPSHVQSEIDLSTFLAHNGQREVHIKALAISGSRSSVELESVSTPKLGDFKISGELVSTEGDCTPMSISSNVPYAHDVSVCLMGNSHFGDLVFQVRGKNQKDVRNFVATVPRREQEIDHSPMPAQPNHCLTQSNQQAHRYLGAVVKDCDHPVIKSYIKDLWLKKDKRKQNLQGFIELNSNRLRGVSNKDTQNLSTILKVLRESGMPELTSLISLVESGFQATISSSAGAGGWWQIMPETAKGLGLRLKPVDERSDLEKSTAAASLYLKSFLDNRETKNDLRLALTSYNCGPGNLKRGSDKARRKLASANGHPYGQLSLDQILAYSKDFWVLRNLKMIPDETADYVPRIMSAMVLAAHPELGSYNAKGKFRLD